MIRSMFLLFRVFQPHIMRNTSRAISLGSSNGIQNLSNDSYGV